MTRSVRCPTGAWPLEMRSDAAAAYCDEPSVPAFLSKVDAGIYPQPTVQKGVQPKWLRTKLDRAIAERHGLSFPDALSSENVLDLI